MISTRKRWESSAATSQGGKTMIHNGFDLIGTTLGRYRIVQRIGQGGYAVVYLAQQEDLSRRVAVKVLFPQAFRDSSTYRDALARFKREAEVIAQANHENIIPIHDYGEQGRFVYLVMPFFSKGSLSTLLDRRRKLPLNEALSYIDQAASALDYAHSHNIVHRDLKPGNFLLDGNGRLVLADFGIAHLTQDKSGIKLTRMDVSLGTPEYMAPEVISPDMLHGEEVDGRVDIYGLGILLFEMLSGDVPFKEENTYAVLLKHLSEPLPSLHHMDPTIPPAVDRVVQKATAKRREDRYASAGEFARALRTAINPAHPFANMPHAISVDQRYVPTLLPSSLASPPPAAGAPTVARALDNELPMLPQTVDPAQWQQRRNRAILPAIILSLLLMVIAGGVWLSSGLLLTLGSPAPQVPCQDLFPSQTSTAVTLTFEQARSLVQQYYCYWNGDQYRLAYNLLGADYRNQYPWQDPDGPPAFSYSATTYSAVTYDNVTANPNGTFQVWITDQAREKAGTNTYSGYFLVGKDRDGTWKLLKPYLTRTGS